MSNFDLNISFTPGDRVRHPGAPDWGIGQIQSVDGYRVTVNFEHAGKQLILVNNVTLVAISEEDDVGEPDH